MSTPSTIIWDPQVEYPSHTAMFDLDIVTQVSVERAKQGEYHYLHETSLALHQDKLWLIWANHAVHEVNARDELLRGTTSTDGISWAKPEVWVDRHENDSDGYNHAVIFSRDGVLWGFFTRWDDGKASMEVFKLDEASGKWQTTGSRLEGFIPFNQPKKMRNGNWIIGGEEGWEEAAVAISDGDDFTSWKMVNIPRDESFVLQFPEVTLLERGDDLIAILRPKDTKTAPVSISKDCGETWSKIEESNYPMGKSQPFCGRLSTGQQYLLANHPEEGRTLLSIAVTKPGESTFCKVWKIRHQAHPLIRLFAHPHKSLVGTKTQWSYPSAIEHDGKLFISYTHGKEDCALSIIPISVLEA